MLSAARVIGLLLLAVPAAMALAVSQFPSYDARSRYFALVTDGPAIWIGFGLLPILWAITFGIVLLVRGDFRMRSGRPSDGQTARP